MVNRALLFVVLFSSQVFAQASPAPVETPSAPAAGVAIEAPTSQASTLVTEVPKPESSLPKLKFAGDIRIRNQIEKKGDDQARPSNRIRARFGVAVDIQKDLKAEIRLATATGYRSTNQSLGDSSEPGSRRRFIGLDLAYGKWSPLPFFTLYGGRFPQIHYAVGGSEMLLDDDLSLEGGGFVSEYEFLKEFFVFGLAGSAFIRENYDQYYSQELGDNMLNFSQLGVKWKRERWQWVLGAGFFNFTSVEGSNFVDLAVGGKANGNSEAAAGVVKYPFLPVELFTELKMPLGPLDVKLFAQQITNREAPEKNLGLWTGIEVGQKSWDMAAAYTSVGADSTLALFTASDIGDGVTDVHGWLGRARWKFAKNMSVRLSQWVHRTDMTGLNKEYRRTNLDLSASF